MNVRSSRKRKKELISPLACLISFFARNPLGSSAATLSVSPTAQPLPPPAMINVVNGGIWCGHGSSIGSWSWACGVSPTLVTAASRGLGRAVAESLLAEDCRVCVASSSEPSIEAAAREMANAGGEVHALAADLGRDEECDRLFAWATSTLGGLDILVNNTVGPPTGGVLEVSDDQWILFSNHLHERPEAESWAAIPVMREGGGGSIVNLASLTAKQPIDGIALSNALRPALVGMAKTLSRKHAPEVRVNNIATEHILTDRIRDIAERIWRQGEESVDDARGGWR